MKKNFILLTSLLVAGTAVAPVLNNNNTQVIAEQSKSLDKVDLTMPWWGTVKVEAPNLMALLNASITPGQYPLKDSKWILTAPDGKAIEATSAFDNGSLRSVLGRATSFTKITLEFSSQHAYANYVMAYYNYWESSENREKSSVVVINRFNWTGIDMTSFWTKDVTSEFELTF